jgi:hypothetical protein
LSRGKQTSYNHVVRDRIHQLDGLSYKNQHGSATPSVPNSNPKFRTLDIGITGNTVDVCNTGTLHLAGDDLATHNQFRHEQAELAGGFGVLALFHQETFDNGGAPSALDQRVQTNLGLRKK